MLEGVRAGQSVGSVDLASVLGADWDLLAIFPPYTSDDDARRALGFEFHAEGSSTYRNDDGRLVALFSKGQLIDWFVLPTTEVDSASIVRSLVVGRDDAIFDVTLLDDQLLLEHRPR